MIKLKYNFVVQKTESGFVAIAVGKDAQKFSGMLRFREEGRVLFELLQKGSDEDDMPQALLASFSGDEKEMREAVTDFIEQLDDAGLLVRI